MSKSRTNAEFGAQRDAELLAAFDRMLANSPADEKMPCIFNRLVLQPASRFYVSELRAIRVVSCILRGALKEKLSPSRRRMYGEIARRVKEMLIADRTLYFADAVVQVVNSPAPEWYMEPSSARVIVYALLRDRRAARRAAHVEGGTYRG